MKNTKLRKTLSLLLCMLMLVGMFPVSTFAAAEDGICEHHLEHTAECGYSEGAAEIPCTHICDDCCTAPVTSCVHTHDKNCGYAAAVEGTPCSHVCGEECAESCVHTEHTDCGYSEGMAEIPCAHSCTEDSGCIVTPEGCPHIHDEICGYAPAAETSPCTHSCESCAAEPESNLICTCGTDDPAIHSTLCPAYAAPENPECFCVEKCPEDAPNEWCDVCGVQGAAACEGGGDEAAAYAEPQVLGDFSVTVESGSATLSGVELELAAGGTYTVSMADGITKSLNTIRITGSGSGVVTNITVNGVNCAVLEDLSTSTVNLTLMGENVFSIRGVAGGNPLTIGGTGSLTADEGINADNCEIIINSGTIIANGIVYSAGIGGGNNASGTVTINGGIVTATGGQDAAGIGGGNNASGTVTINGGTVTATGAGYAAGIGGGVGGAGTVAISGGTITSHSSFYQSIGGSGNDESSVIITGGGFTLDPHVSGAYKIVRHATGGNVAVKLNGTDIVAAGASQTLSVIPTPSEGYELKGLYLLGANDTAPTENHYIDTNVFRTNALGGSYDFDMPNQDVTVHAVFQQMASVESYPITTEVIGYPGARLYAYTGTYPYDAELNDAGAVTEAALYSTFNVMLDASTEETSINKLPEGYELVGLYINPTDYPETHYIDSTAFPSNYMSWGPEYIYGGTYYTCMVFGPTHVVAVVANTQTSEETNPTVKLNGVEIKSNQYLPSGATAASALTQVAPSGGYARLYENNGILTLELNNAAFTSGGLQLVGSGSEPAITIKLTGDNALTGTNHGLLDDYNAGTGTKITFTGTGSLVATGGSGTDDVGIFGNDAIIVSDGVTIAATGGGYGIRAGAGFTSSGNVTASGSEYGIVTTAGNLAISGGTLTASGSIKALQPGTIPVGSVTCSVSPVRAGDNETSAAEVWDGTGSLPDLTQYKYVQVGNNAPDIIPPVLTAGEVSRTSDTEATVKFTSSEAGTYTYTVVPSGSTAVGMAISGDCTAGENTITLTNLTAGAQDISIRVTDAAGNASDWLTITIPAYEAPTAVTGVSISPDTATVEKGGTQQFTATVTGTGSFDDTVSWSVSGNAASGTTISDTGLLTVAADETAETIRVIATSNGDSSMAASTEVTVKAPDLIIPYLDAGGAQQSCTNPTKYTGQTTLSAGWYYVDGTVSTSSRINVSGDVHLILCDGATLTASGGIGVSSGRSLTIYGQTNGTGTLNATTGTNGASGIGGNSNQAAGTITINGGIVTARGGRNGTGIGGGQNAAAGTVIINGGAVTATGGNNGAGIGDGALGYSTAVIINGGTVTANGGSNAAGIGHGAQGSGALTIKINGGSVKAGVTSNTSNPQNDAAARVYKNEVTLPAGRTVSEIQILNADGTEYAYGRRDMKPDATGKLYLWLPDEGVTVSAPTEPVKYTITASASNDSLGSVTGGGTYVHGESVTLAATPAEGYRLVGWKEADTQVSTDNPYTFTANADRSLVAVFELKEYEVTVSADPAEGGTVSGGGTYKHGDTATLTASANTGYQFMEWQENGQQISTDTTYTFAVESVRSLVAVFRKVTYGVDITADPTAGGSVSGGGTYEHGMSVTVTATPAEGYSFVRWTENGSMVSTAASYTFTAEAARSLVAVFELAEYEVTVSADPAEGGTVTGGGTYKHGDTATLTASANTGYQFVEWQENGQQVSTDTTYTFAVESVRSLVAVFRKVTYGVDITADPTAGGSVSGGGTYEHGTSVTVTATPAEGYSFVRWTENGSTVSTAASYTFTAEAARSLVAEFTERVVFTSPATNQVVTVTAGQSATFEITAENANFYEWYVDKGDGNGFVIIDNTDSSSYTTAPVTLDNDGWVYRCRGVNDASFVDSPTFTLRVTADEPAADPVITTTSLPDGTVGTAYSQTLASDAPDDITVLWHIAQGALPDGLTLSTSGVISGTPTKAGTFRFTVVIFDAAESFSDTQELSITVSENAGTEHILGGWDYDSKNHWRSCSCDEYHDYGPHSFGPWKVTKEATTYTNGSKERSCSVCGYTEKATIQATVIPKTGDNNLVGLCIALMALSLCGIIVAPRFRKRGAHEIRR